jgi:hypothetical protein
MRSLGKGQLKIPELYICCLSPVGDEVLLEFVVQQNSLLHIENANQNTSDFGPPHTKSSPPNSDCLTLKVVFSPLRHRTSIHHPLPGLDLSYSVPDSRYTIFVVQEFKFRSPNAPDIERREQPNREIRKILSLALLNNYGRDYYIFLFARLRNAVSKAQ